MEIFGSLLRAPQKKVVLEEALQSPVQFFVDHSVLRLHFFLLAIRESDNSLSNRYTEIYLDLFSYEISHFFFGEKSKIQR